MAKRIELTASSDSELYELLCSKRPGNDDAFKELYRRYSPRVYRYCIRILSQRELAEDAFQECFVRFYRGAMQGREVGNVLSYLIKIARNYCLDLKSSKHYGLADLSDLQLSVGAARYEKKELLELIRLAIDDLPDDYREAFVLRTYDGISYQEIAEILGITTGLVKTRIFRAKDRLRKILAPFIQDVQREV